MGSRVWVWGFGALGLTGRRAAVCRRNLTQGVSLQQKYTLNVKRLKASLAGGGGGEF